MNKHSQFMEIVTQADFIAIESARDQVTFRDLGALVKAYETLETWDQKAALINLVQDHLDPRMRRMMEDFIGAPDDLQEDNIILTKAIALCHLQEDFDRFMDYYNDRGLLERTVRQFMDDSPREKGPDQISNISHTSIQSKEKNPYQGLLSISVALFIIASALILLAYINQSTLDRYRREGVEVEATLLGKVDDGSYCLRVSYFTSSVLEDGELVLTTICDYISKSLWDSLQEDQRIDVVFLPDDLAEDTLLKASLDSSKLIPLRGYLPGLILMLIAASLLSLRWVLLRMSSLS
jgi:hypothetical protein